MPDESAQRISPAGDSRPPAPVGSDRPTRFEKIAAPKPRGEKSAPPSPDSTAVKASAPSFDVAKGTIVAGKYRLERLLKAGGMGAVWVATHLTLDVAVAIKFMVMPDGVVGGSHSKGSQGDPDAVSRARFEREAKMAAQLRSVNVVQILDYGVDRSTAYIVMELLGGEGLDHRIRDNKRMSLKDTARLMVPVLNLLQRAHDAGMVHRDLKPANIFISMDGDAEVPKVLDFGVAKATQTATTAGDLTADRMLIGTPSYSSPEQLKNSAKIDHRADLWSMGVVLFRMLTGQKPFKGGQLVEAIVEVCSAPIPLPSSIAPELPPEVDTFFQRALTRDLDRRFQSAREMAQALTDLIAALEARNWVPPPEDKADEEELLDLDLSSIEPPADAEPSSGLTPFAHSTAGASVAPSKRRPAWLAPALIALALAVTVPIAVLALRSPGSPRPAVAASPASDPASASSAPLDSAPFQPASPAGEPTAAASASAAPSAGSALSPSASPPRSASSAAQGVRASGATSHPGPAPSAPATRSTSRPPSSKEDKEVGY
jgi:serine/threonine-protein kinase